MGEAIISRRGGGEYGTAGPEHVLTGYTLGTENGVVSGTMPNRAGDTAALSISRSGTTIKLRASQGYRDGVDDNVTHTDPNDLPENIKQGVTIRGQTGTCIPLTNEKKWASGTITKTSTNVEQDITVNSLSFVPSLIFIYLSDPPYNQQSAFGVAVTGDVFRYNASGGFYGGDQTYVSRFSPSSNGFTIRVYGVQGVSYTWYAFE